MVSMMAFTPEETTTCSQIKISPIAFLGHCALSEAKVLYGYTNASVFEDNKVGMAAVQGA